MGATSDDKWKYSACAGILFFIVANPAVYRIVDRLLGDTLGRIASATGCPSQLGVVVHALVYALLIRALMDMK